MQSIRLTKLMIASVLALAALACPAIAQDVVIQGQARVAYVTQVSPPGEPGVVIRPPVPATVGQLIDFQINFFPPWSVYAPFPYYSADVVAQISGETLTETAIPVLIGDDVMSEFPLLLTPGVAVDDEPSLSEAVPKRDSRLCESSSHESDHGEVNEGFGGDGGLFVVASRASVS